MHESNSFIKKTRGGKVLKVIREHYLRDDIWSGTPLDPECNVEAHKLSSTAKHYLVIDTNVALHQIDFLEHPAICDVVVCSVVLKEVEHKNKAAYQRLRALCASPTKRFFVFSNENHTETFIKGNPGESPNDRNDRAIRVATMWYASRLKGKMSVILLTNDVDSRRKAQEDGLDAQGVFSYAKGCAAEVPELLDLVAASAAAEEEENQAAGGEAGSSGQRPAKRKKVYTDHKSYNELMAGMKDGRYHQGSLRVCRFNPFEGWVGSDSVGQDILISGRVDMNRALDGDVVVVELLPEAQWRSAGNKLPSAKRSNDDVSTAPDEEEVDEEGLGGAEVQVAPGEHFEETGGDGVGKAGEKRPTGQVVGIIKRNWRTRGYCGSLKPPSTGAVSGGGHSSSVLFLPIERRYPMIRLQTRQAHALMDKRLLVGIDSWDVDSMYPSGHYIKTIGTIGDRETETEVLLIENDINTSPFTPAVHDCVPPLPWSCDAPTELAADPKRKDLRDLCVCSVDPPGCRDIDDALHARLLPNGNVEVGVHIADVTHFLKPETAMDTEAATRGTSVYLVERRIDMLPKPLTEDICSLRGGVERLTFSVIWEMTQDAHVVSAYFTKAIIKSRAALSYQEAQTRMDDEKLEDDITVSLRTMNRLAKILRLRRAEQGALQLASPEVKFTIDTDNSMDLGMYQVREANQMVEELMLLANISVAEKIVHHFASCSLLRRHPTPAPRQFEPIVKAAASAGFTIETETSKALAESLDKAVRTEDPYFNKLVRIMATRCMTQAVYFGSGELGAQEYHHYGLASPIYTHFTSPIRRYADVLVHRCLAAALGLDPLPDSARDREGLKNCSDNLNKRHHNAQMAGRASVELHTLIFFDNKTVVADARITKVKANGLIVFVPKYGIEGPVYLTPAEYKGPALPGGAGKARGKGGGSSSNNRVAEAEEAAGGGGGAYVLDEETQTVMSRDGSVKFTIFEPCAVRITVEEGIGHRKRLVLALAPRDEVKELDRV